jgi:nucleoside-diphosphate-sugar epimerase
MNEPQRPASRSPSMSEASGSPNLIVGCGDIGGRVAQRLQARGETVHAIVRTEKRANELASLGITATVLDLDEDAPPSASRVYWFAPPPERGTTDPRLRRWLSAAGPVPRRIAYISTSAVYGDCAGRWIDEDEPLKPQTDRGRRRLDAECALREYAQSCGGEVLILRVPGIYGPGRLPLARLSSGQPVLLEAEAPYTNRIHAEDLATVALAAMDRGRAGAAYNVSDGHPSTMSDYFLRCARLLGLPEPPRDRKSTRLNSSHNPASRMPSSA